MTDYRRAFSGLNEATVEERLPALVGKDGIHKFQVDVHRAIKNEDGQITAFVCETTILVSDCAKVKEGIERTSAVIGGLAEPVAWKRKKAFGRLKAHLAGVWGIPADSNQDWIGLLEMCADHNAAEGATFYAQTRHYQYEKDKEMKDGVDFTYQVDQDNPLFKKPELQDFYKALRAAS